MNSKETLSLLCAGLMAGPSCTDTPKDSNEKQDQKPNVIVFLADDLGYNDLSCYRNAHPPHSEKPPTCKTPFIDNLAEEGMRFTDFYAGAAVSSPSRSAFLTGRNKTRVGIYNWIPTGSPMHLRSEEITIAEMLNEAGYRTGHFGKWHLTSKGMDQPLPNDQGFDYSFFTYNNAEPSHKNPVNYYRNNKAVGKLEGYACQLVVDEAINWLGKDENKNHPFYLNVWFNEPHVKVAAPDSLASKHEYRKEYYGCIENMDYAVGKLMKYIKEKGLDDNTIIIFSSDNGSPKPHSNDPLRGEKAFNYEGGLRVPFIIKYTGVVPEGKVNKHPGGFVDVLPTLADFTGAEVSEDRFIDGISLTPIMRDVSEEVERKHPLFFYRYFHDPICMLREGKWCLLGYEEIIPYKENLNPVELAKFKPGPDEGKWSQWGFQESHMEVIPAQEPEHFELYNLREDKEQKHDLADEYPDRVKEMKKTMLQLREEMIEEGGNWFE